MTSMTPMTMTQPHTDHRASIESASRTDCTDMTVPADSWWANAVVYQIYPRSFADANGDGEGDLKGVTGRIDYLKALGVDAIWLSPFYPSPLADGGYDVADYCDVDPRFGTLADFDALVAAAHAAGIRVIVDIVPNHTSDRHPWFQAALNAGPESPEAQRYVFRRGKGEHGEEPPTNWLSNFGGSAWQACGDGWWYLHLFAREQPDLNWDNPDVRKEFHRILRFWCNRGVDGFRVDVSHGLAKDLADPLRDRPDPMVMGPQAADGSDPLWDRDAVHEIYRGWRQVLDEYQPRIYAVGESWMPFTPRIFQYARPDELGAVFDFSLSKAAWDLRSYRDCIDRTWQQAREAHSVPTWVLGNHDVPRVASRLGLPVGADVEAWVTSDGALPRIDPAQGLRRARAAALMTFGLPGTTFVYQGEELGLPEDLELTEAQIQDPNWERSGHRFKGRDGCRVPLPWQAGGSAFGFNTTGTAWLPQPDWFRKYAADRESGASGSTLELYRAAAALRRTWVGSPGADLPDLTWVDGLPDGLLGWRLGTGLTVVTNFTTDQTLAVPDSLAGARILLSSDAGWVGWSGQGDRNSWIRPSAGPATVPPETAVWLSSCQSD